MPKESPYVQTDVITVEARHLKYVAGSSRDEGKGISRSIYLAMSVEYRSQTVDI